MSVQFYAQPYDLAASGFYFSDAQSFEAETAALKNDCGETVEEFEIQFIDGDRLDGELFKALSVHQGSIATFIGKLEEWAEWEKVHLVIAVGEMGYNFDIEHDHPDSVDIDVYEIDTMRELAERFVDDGLFGDIPQHLENYIDYDAIARDLSYDYAQTQIDGQSYAYRSC